MLYPHPIIEAVLTNEFVDEAPFTPELARTRTWMRYVDMLLTISRLAARHGLFIILACQQLMAGRAPFPFVGAADCTLHELDGLLHVFLYIIWLISSMGMHSLYSIVVIVSLLE